MYYSLALWVMPYVVALVTEVNKEGTMSPRKARMMVEAAIDK